MKKTLISVTYISVVHIAALLFSCDQREHFEIESSGETLRVELVADSLRVPFGMDFLPGGQLIVSDRAAGKLFKINISSGRKCEIRNTPAVLTQGDGGMLDVLVHPNYLSNGWIYLSYAIARDSLSTLVVERAKLKSDTLFARERIFEAFPYFKEPNHFGNRMVIQNGYLFVTMGDRYFLRDSAQTLSNHLGKIIRLHDDGRIPSDNPFVNIEGAKGEVWTYGHRNPQGLALHPTTGDLWEHEHGPKGGDEVNIIRAGVNYGWPVICYGIDYDGKPIGEGITSREGMAQPEYFYVPSIAPSGMTFYTSDQIPGWRGNLFIGAMALQHLNRLVLDGDKVIYEERLLSERKWRIRNVKQGPEGFLYYSVDGRGIWRIRPR